jgi:hypothetical protein
MRLALTPKKAAQSPTSRKAAAAVTADKQQQKPGANLARWSGGRASALRELRKRPRRDAKRLPIVPSGRGADPGGDARLSDGMQESQGVPGE